MRYTEGRECLDEGLDIRYTEYQDIRTQGANTAVNVLVNVSLVSDSTFVRMAQILL